MGVSLIADLMQCLKAFATDRTMNGPNEFTVIGSMAHESIEDRLHEIKIPVLHATGRYDEVAPSVTESIRSRIKGSELIVVSLTLTIYGRII